MVWGDDAGIPVTDIYNEVADKRIRVGDCTDQSGWSWDKILRRHASAGITGENRVAQLKEALNGIRVGQGPDEVKWRWNANGRFTVRSTYRVINDGGLRDRSALTAWCPSLPLKVQIFVWLAIKKRIQTTDNIAKRGWIGNLLCVLCGTELESTDHLLTKCVYTRFLLWTIGGNLDWNGSGIDTRGMWERGTNAGGMSRLNSYRINVAAIWWLVWRVRNKVIIQNTSTDPLIAKCWAERLGKQWGENGGLGG